MPPYLAETTSDPVGLLGVNDRQLSSKQLVWIKPSRRRRSFGAPLKRASAIP